MPAHKSVARLVVTFATGQRCDTRTLTHLLGSIAFQLSPPPKKHRQHLPPALPLPAPLPPLPPILLRRAAPIHMLRPSRGRSAPLGRAAGARPRYPVAPARTTFTPGDAAIAHPLRRPCRPCAPSAPPPRTQRRHGGAPGALGRSAAPRARGRRGTRRRVGSAAKSYSRGKNHRRRSCPPRRRRRRHRRAARSRGTRRAPRVRRPSAGRARRAGTRWARLAVKAAPSAITE